MKFLRELKSDLSYAFFKMNGMKPWTTGYNDYKRRSIIKSLSIEEFDVNRLPSCYGYRLDERIIEYPWFFSRLPKLPGRLLDAGSILNFDYIISHDSLRMKKVYIVTLAPESFCFWDKGISYIYDDLRETCFKDNFFDWIVSLSTIEHIGLDNTFLYTNDVFKKEKQLSSYLYSIQEYYRILKPGGILYLSFPFGEHKDFGWFQIFNSQMVDQIINTFSPKKVIEYHYKYSQNGWRISSRDESKNASYFDIHQEKKYFPDYVAASQAIVCLEMTK